MSASVDFMIKGQRVYTSNGFMPLAVGAKDGKIVTITKLDAAPRGREEYDAGRQPVLPVIIDPDTHMRGPGYTQREDWTNGTLAAAAGGVTCVISTVPGREQLIGWGSWLRPA